MQIKEVAYRQRKKIPEYLSSLLCVFSDKCMIYASFELLNYRCRYLFIYYSLSQQHKQRTIGQWMIALEKSLTESNKTGVACLFNDDWVHKLHSHKPKWKITRAVPHTKSQLNFFRYRFSFGHCSLHSSAISLHETKKLEYHVEYASFFHFIGN